MSNCIVGIDLGTSTCCCSVYRNGNIEVIPDPFTGNRTIPSYISFTDNEVLVGVEAKNQVNYNPNTVYDCKRIIGKCFNDVELQKDMKYFSFTVKDNNNNPVISINNKEYTPEELCSFILLKLKSMCQSYLGCSISDVVVTIPAYFNNQQRESTKIALEMAGLNCVRILNEPTAVAIAYGLDQYSNEEKHILVFDCGGGTSDITILSVCEGVFQVKATAGNPHLGGEDFDNKLVTWCMKEFYQKNKNIDLNHFIKNKKVLSRLKTSCENAKKILSTALSTTIQLDCLYDEIDFSVTLTRSKFEDICYDLFKQCEDILSQALLESKLSKDSIDCVLLAGGSTRIPKIKSIINDYFNNKDIFSNINPDEVISAGASIVGAILSKENNKKLNDTVLIDVNSLSLGIESSSGQMVKIIPKNTPIPTSAQKIFSTVSNNQPSLVIRVYEGENNIAKQNNLLGEFYLTDIPPMPKCVPRIIVRFEIDSSGILQVSATEESTNISQTIVINKK